MKKEIPNIITLLNLLLGSLAIVYILQPGLTLTLNSGGEHLIVLPERIMWAGWLIIAAAVVDFFDGFIARLLKVPSEMGKQLDSLADVVSFGVAPGLIVFQFLRLSFSQQPDGLDISLGWLMPALIIPCAGAYRLARFNIDTTQQYGFKGVPIPAVGLFFAAFPMLYWYTQDVWILTLLLNKWLWYALILVTSYLMVSTLPMLALKFKGFTVKKALPFIIIAVVSLVSAIVFGWLAVSIGFFAYVILSLTFKQVETDHKLK
jgi:CDP-diacylglycerol--serine O-phosphatidyltransferase